MSSVPKAAKDLRAIALFEAVKGTVVLLAGVGALRYGHLDPVQKVPHVFLQLVTDLADTRTWILALALSAYAGVRYVLAWGLWTGRPWALWLGAGAGLIYVPLELVELTHEVTPLLVAFLIGNVVVVTYLLWRLRHLDGSAA